MKTGIEGTELLKMINTDKASASPSTMRGENCSEYIENQHRHDNVAFNIVGVRQDKSELSFVGHPIESHEILVFTHSGFDLGENFT